MQNPARPHTAAVPFPAQPPLPAAPTSSPRRFLVAGAPAVRPDGTIDDGLEAQMQCAWLKLFDVMRAEGFEKHHLLSTTMCVTVGGQTRLYRLVRDRMLGGCPVPCSYLHVDGLETAAPLVEIEGEAAKG
jgi:2-iminobutanoate/2-iminopropanoate deaminase